MKEFYDFLKRNDLTPNGHYVLYCMVNNNSCDTVNYLHEQYKLCLNGYLTEVNDPVIGYTYKLTPRASQIVHESEVYICNLGLIKKVSKISYKDWEEKIKDYNELFPKGRKSGSTVSFRTNPKELYDKFKWFFTEYPEYDWETILRVTKKYVEQFEEGCDYTYMQTSKYFIKKDDKNRVTTSTLATMCYNMIEGNDESISSGFHYFGP
jgi:hypothetical protein